MRTAHWPGVKCRLKTGGKLQTLGPGDLHMKGVAGVKCRLQTGGKMQTADWGKMQTTDWG